MRWTNLTMDTDTPHRLLLSPDWLYSIFISSNVTVEIEIPFCIPKVSGSNLSLETSFCDRIVVFDREKTQSITTKNVYFTYICT
jgi:hypothetical protein